MWFGLPAVLLSSRFQRRWAAPFGLEMTKLISKFEDHNVRRALSAAE